MGNFQPSINLVTGGIGFLGSYLNDSLLKNGEKVVCIDNYLKGRKKNIKLTNANEGTWIKENKLDKSFVNVVEILILTEWGIYKKINWKTIEKVIRKLIWVFDTPSIMDLKEIKNSNLNFWRICDEIKKP